MSAKLSANITVNFSGEIVALNPLAVELLGFHSNELIGIPITQVIPEYQKMLIHPVASHQWQGKGMSTPAIHHTIPIQTKSSGAIQRQIYIDYLPKEQLYKVCLPTMNSNDIPTEVSRRYEFIVNTSKELMSLVNRNYQYEAINDEHCRIRNQSREEILGRTIAELWDDDLFLNTIKDPLDRCFTNQVVSYQAYYEHATKGMRYMDVTYYPYSNPDGEVTHAVIVQRDVTEKEQAEQAVRRYARRLETLHEIDRGILAAQSSEEIAEAALEHLQYLVPFQHASIVVFEKSKPQSAELMNGHQGQEFPFMVMRNGRRGQVYDIEHTQVLAQLATEPLSEEPSSNLSYINIPLVAQGELLGSLSLGANDTAIFNGEHGDIAREVAYQVALAVQQAQLRNTLRIYTTELEVLVQERTQEIERRRQVAEGMQDILRILNSDRPLDEVLMYILTQARLLLDTDWITFIGTADNEHGLEMETVHSLNTNGLSHDELTVSYRLALHALSMSYPTIVSKSASHRKIGVYQELWKGVELEQIRHNSMVAVPLSANQESYGAIVLYYLQSRDVSEEEINTAVSLADQAALAIENARLHERAEQVAVMEERERLARDLHDSVTQSLYSLTLFSEAGQRVMKVGNTLRVSEYLSQLSETARQALKEMRLLLYELRPVVLEQEGLIGALRRRLDAVEKRANISVRYDVTEPIVLPPSTEECLYRIAQEALNNSLKYSGANLVTVHILLSNHSVTMEIADNGIGFDVNEALRSGGMGLLNMRERTYKLNGEIIIQSELGKGTTISITIETEKKVDQFMGVSQHKLIEVDGGK
ncbi:MAG: GAF domain-containing protein [Chloroflexota bacterium]